MNTVNENFLASAIKFFVYYKQLGEKAMAQLTEEEVLDQPNEASNSIGLIVHHLSGNMLSRFTDFLTSDGEKSWRNREVEFEETYASKAEMMAAWEKGWKCLLDALQSLTPSDLSQIIYIRMKVKPYRKQFSGSWLIIRTISAKSFTKPNWLKT